MQDKKLRRFILKEAIKYHKNFVDGIQNEIFNQTTGNTTSIVKDFYWEENKIYNKLLCIKNIKAPEKDIYGINGLVSKLVDLQLLYNKLINTKNNYLLNCTYPSLAVEDGSIDIDAFEEEGLAPGKILVYRQGAQLPVVLNPNFSSDLIKAYDDQLIFIAKQINSIINEFKGSIKDDTKETH